jgi:hypothetical protein
VAASALAGYVTDPMPYLRKAEAVA